VCVYIYIYSGYILSIRSGIVEAAQTLPRAGKNSKNRKSGQSFINCVVTTIQEVGYNGGHTLFATY
jgi:hypothetical protein